MCLNGVGSLPVLMGNCSLNLQPEGASRFVWLLVWFARNLQLNADGNIKRGFAYGKIPFTISFTKAAECLAAAVSKVG